MNISYDSSKLIAELKKDILEFNNFELYAISHEIDGIRFYTDYDFSDLDLDPDESAAFPLKVGEMKETMKASDLLSLLEKQNSVL
ncbi:hypothetical protein LABALGLTS371_05120 [Dellaglioa algida]|uniref:Uncharacterized protein n=1 Tax=Dellaglioa algida TaxID=105612 RepID=A0A5C6MAY0_9LACO|nr:hypothetical protein [Dellaglioa algida]TWW11339.1 hypothetical protein LABALGLTS371_05120 [Dellaglioa algida]